MYFFQVPLISLDSTECRTSPGSQKPDSFQDLPNILKRTFQNTFTGAGARGPADQENQVRGFFYDEGQDFLAAKVAAQ